MAGQKQATSVSWLSPALRALHGKLSSTIQTVASMPRIDHIHAPLMPATFKWLLQPLGNNIESEITPREPLAETQNIAVIVPSGHACSKRLMAHNGAHPRHPIGGHAHTNSAAADKNAHVGLSTRYRPRNLIGINRIVHRVAAVCAGIEHFNALVLQKRCDLIFEPKSSVIRSQNYFHPNPLEHESLANMAFTRKILLSIVIVFFKSLTPLPCHHIDIVEEEKRKGNQHSLEVAHEETYRSEYDYQRNDHDLNDSCRFLHNSDILDTPPVAGAGTLKK